MFRAILFSFLYLLALSAPVSAQYADVLTIQTEPSFVQKDAPTSVTVESPSLILESALIIWSLDGKEVARGIGKTDTTVTLVDTAPHEVAVSVTEREGVSRTEKRTLRASDIDLLWEAETLVPPLYSGRALPSVESTVRAEVHLHGSKNTTPGTHIYTWSLGGKSLKAQSGIGKNTIRFQLPTFENSALLQVSVTSIAGDPVGQTSVRIYTQNPFVVFYEKRPLIGLWTNTTVASLAPQTERTTVSAFPFFLSAYTQQDAALSYRWDLPRGSVATEGDDASPADVLIASSEPFRVKVVRRNTLLQEAVGEGRIQTAAEGGINGVFEISE
jgi:hypothetical protein